MGKVQGTGLSQLPLSHLLPNTPEQWGRAWALEAPLLLTSPVSPAGYRTSLVLSFLICQMGFI